MSKNESGSSLDLESPSIAAVTGLLRERYGDCAHHDPANPLSDLLFVICSRKTHEKNYRAAYRELRRSFPTFRLLAKATEGEIASAISVGGLASVKAAQIKGLLDLLIRRFGRPTLAPLRRMSDEECERFLTSLPGVGKKIARCVLMATLGREVFPVDTHVWRICQRLGWVPRHRLHKVCSPSDRDTLQSMVPKPLRISLHLNLMSFGREICKAQRPACERCPLAGMCPRVGLGEPARRPISAHAAMA